MPNKSKNPIELAIDAGKKAYKSGSDCFAPINYRSCDVLMSAWLKGWKDAYRTSKATI